MKFTSLLKRNVSCCLCAEVKSAASEHDQLQTSSSVAEAQLEHGDFEAVRIQAAANAEPVRPPGQ